MKSQPSKSEVIAAISILASASRLPADVLIKQCEAESSFDQRARSAEGAIGLMQLMPDTAKELGVDAEDGKQNLHGGICYMGKLMKQFGSLDQALAAYNWGPGHLRRLLKERPRDWRQHLPPETGNYLDRIIGKCQGPSQSSTPEKS